MKDTTSRVKIRAGTQASATQQDVLLSVTTSQDLVAMHMDHLLATAFNPLSTVRIPPSKV